MAELLVSMVGAFIGVMIAEGLVKPVAVKAWQNLAGAGMDLLPSVYELTDPLVPDWLYNGEDIEKAARERYRALTGVVLPDNVLAEWRRRFDLQIAANHNSEERAKPPAMMMQQAPLINRFSGPS